MMSSMYRVLQCTGCNANRITWADGANQPVVMLTFQPRTTVLFRLSASELARGALHNRRMLARQRHKNKYPVVDWICYRTLAVLVVILHLMVLVAFVAQAIFASHTTRSSLVFFNLTLADPRSVTRWSMTVSNVGEVLHLLELVGASSPSERVLCPCRKLVALTGSSSHRLPVQRIIAGVSRSPLRCTALATMSLPLLRAGRPERSL